MRMSADQLRGNRLHRIDDVEAAGFGAELRVKDALEEDITELAGQIVELTAVDRLEQLVGFFEQKRAQRLVCLLAIPGAAMPRAQGRHDPDEAGKGGAGGTRSSCVCHSDDMLTQ